MQKLFQAADPDDTADVGMVDADYQRWKDTYGRQFNEFYGMVSPDMGTASHDMDWPTPVVVVIRWKVEWFKSIYAEGRFQEACLILRTSLQSPPATRQELENFYQGYEAARQVPAEPKSLPPGRQTPVMEALRPASRDRMPQREAVRVRRPAPRWPTVPCALHQQASRLSSAWHLHSSSPWTLGG